MQNRIIFPQQRKKKPLRQRIAQQLPVIDARRRRQRGDRGIVHQLGGFVGADPVHHADVIRQPPRRNPAARFSRTCALPGGQGAAASQVKFARARDPGRGRSRSHCETNEAIPSQGWSDASSSRIESVLHGEEPVGARTPARARPRCRTSSCTGARGRLSGGVQSGEIAETQPALARPHRRRCPSRRPASSFRGIDIHHRHVPARPRQEPAERHPDPSGADDVSRLHPTHVGYFRRKSTRIGLAAASSARQGRAFVSGGQNPPQRPAKGRGDFVAPDVASVRDDALATDPNAVHGMPASSPENRTGRKWRRRVRARPATRSRKPAATISAGRPAARPPGPLPNARLPPASAPSKRLRPLDAPAPRARTLRPRLVRRWEYSNVTEFGGGVDVHVGIRADPETSAWRDERDRREDAVAQVGLRDGAQAHRRAAARQAGRFRVGVMCVAWIRHQRRRPAQWPSSHSTGRAPVAATQSSTSFTCSAAWMWMGRPRRQAQRSPSVRRA